MTAHPLSDTLATAVQEVPGVAFLTPGITDRLLSAFDRSRAPGASSAAVRISAADGTGPATVDVRVVTRANTRTLDVTRAIRTALGPHLALAYPERDVRVTVTVTGMV
ncbi:hypothetical protein ABT160_33220 [Streptomyces sp. NPDC001941]|uniref:hypothetical protein n=1 Tax=Streptomyces sp. NPDC001941 TaxID=3154659 RepID=UPI00331A3363